MSYYDFVKDYMKVDECKNNEKYSSAGHTFCWKKENSTYAEGLYWFYEGGSFIIDIKLLPQTLYVLLILII